MKQAVKLLANEWDLGKVSSRAKGNVCVLGFIYLKYWKKQKKWL